ncbi:MAG: PLP-dependent aminotransferase family protein [Opitutaceae bacterium]
MSSESDSSAPTGAFRFAARTRHLQPSAIREILKVAEAPDVISFAGGLPAPDLFPVAAIASATASVLAQSGPAALQYGVSEGHLPLRAWIAEHLAQTLGLVCRTDNLLVVQGSQQGLDLVAKVLIDPGDLILTENPAYLGALQAFRAYEAKVVGLRSDADGLLPEALADWLHAAPVRPKFLYLTPNFQNPTGTCLAEARRREVVAIAARHGVPILEDDPYGRLRYSGSPAPALATLPGAGPCLYLGTFSKVLAPGLRVAWIVTPDRTLHDKLVTAKQAADLHTSTFTQRVVTETVRVPGFLDAHVARLIAAYRLRRDAMLAALERHFPAGCTWTRPDGGLFLWVTVPPALDTHAFLPTALAGKVAYVPGAPFWVDLPVRNTLRLNFSNASAERIEEGIGRLGSALRAALR